MSTEVELAQYIADAKYEDLPGDVVDATKKHIMDTVGVAIAGSNYSVCGSVANQVRSWAGKQESTIFV